MFPSAYSWSAVMQNITTFLSEPIMATAVLFSIALVMVPRMVGALRSSLGSGAVTDDGLDECNTCYRSRKCGDCRGRGCDFCGGTGKCPDCSW